MGMIPEKTGAMLYLSQYGMCVRCDLYLRNEMLIAQANGEHRLEYVSGMTLHARVDSVLQWFSAQMPNSILLAEHGNFQYFGREGTNHPEAWMQYFRG